VNISPLGFLKTSNADYQTDTAS